MCSTLCSAGCSIHQALHARSRVSSLYHCLAVEVVAYPLSARGKFKMPQRYDRKKTHLQPGSQNNIPPHGKSSCAGACNPIGKHPHNHRCRMPGPQWPLPMPAGQAGNIPPKEQENHVSSWETERTATPEKRKQAFVAFR